MKPCLTRFRLESRIHLHSLPFMRPSVRMAVLLVASALVARAQDEAAPRAAATTTSPDVAKRVIVGLPKYSPPPPEKPEPKPGDPVKPITPEDIARAANPDNADVLVLPKMTIKQKPRPRLNPQLVATPQALGADFLKRRTTELDRALNKFTLPLFGVSAEQQALEDYRRERARELNLDVLSISKALQQADPEAAKALRDASTAATTTATAPGP